MRVRVWRGMLGKVGGKARDVRGAGLVEQWGALLNLRFGWD